ncbi:MAG: DUF924 domain-containing protein [Gammaproteobacteria bacterium PRO9]|nr:DUF924 domain-containing protein [Gammaproteobacteria bacterium PRO9]
MNNPAAATNNTSTVVDPDIRRVLDFWFQPDTRDQPTVDSRMDRWFTADAVTDALIRTEFGGLVDKASRGQLDHWAGTPEGRLALIVLLDQFRRNIHRGTPKAFSRDPQALKLCVEGAMKGDYKGLDPFQQAFYFMPLQHAESLKIQQRSVKIYEGMVSGVSATLKETFATFAQFAELHHDIIESFGRFPHRNRILGRTNTPEESEYLAAGAPAFGQ